MIDSNTPVGSGDDASAHGLLTIIVPTYNRVGHVVPLLAVLTVWRVRRTTA